MHAPVVIPGSNLVPPVLTYNPRGGRWRLAQRYPCDDHGTRLEVPRGFAFDLASVPRSAWWAIAPFEFAILAPLLHDFLYVHGGRLPAAAVHPYRAYTRRETDLLFLEIMRREGIAGWRCRTAFNAVRLFGGAVWPGAMFPEEERAIRLLPV